MLFFVLCVFAIISSVSVSLIYTKSREYTATNIKAGRRRRMLDVARNIRVTFTKYTRRIGFRTFPRVSILNLAMTGTLSQCKAATFLSSSVKVSNTDRDLERKLVELTLRVTSSARPRSSRLPLVGANFEGLKEEGRKFSHAIEIYTQRNYIARTSIICRKRNLEPKRKPLHFSVSDEYQKLM